MKEEDGWFRAFTACALTFVTVQYSGRQAFGRSGEFQDS
jgi:hypothetical protein